MKPVAETIAVIALLSVTGLSPAERGHVGSDSLETVRLETVFSDHRISSTLHTGDDRWNVAGATHLQF